MSGISISLRASGAAVAFPFELKDAFRAAFPSAKWEPSAKVWTVGPRSVKRLKSWVAEVEASGIVEELATRDEREMSANEVKRLRIQLSNMCRALEKENSSKESAEALKSEADMLRAHLTAIASEYDAAKAAADAVAAEAAKATAEMSVKVQRTVNIEALGEALHKLRALRPAQAAERVKHEKYTKVVAISFTRSRRSASRPIRFAPSRVTTITGSIATAGRGSTE